VCGGSRSRAYALTGDHLAEDEACGYVPEPDAKRVTLPV
jgi:MoaA/NifB/PqqE/SkfB family radical SAM enzyme